MNPEKLKKLQAQVRIGGKGTPRRKKKVFRFIFNINTNSYNVYHIEIFMKVYVLSANSWFIRESFVSSRSLTAFV